MKVMVYVSNRYGGWTPAALAARLGMVLTSSGDYRGMLTPEELAEVRDSGVSYRIDWKVTSTT